MNHPVYALHRLLFNLLCRVLFASYKTGTSAQSHLRARFPFMGVNWDCLCSAIGPLFALPKFMEREYKHKTSPRLFESVQMQTATVQRSTAALALIAIHLNQFITLHLILWLVTGSIIDVFTARPSIVHPQLSYISFDHMPTVLISRAHCVWR